MIPRTVKMSAEVASTFTVSDLENYGNIILNGYLESVPNTINKKAWQYKETVTAPVNLPSLTQITPALKGWTNNYQEYYTQLQPNDYDVDPGDPTMFEYNVHSYTQSTGPVLTVGNLQAGEGYNTGTYLNVPTVGGSGTGATLNLVIGLGGVVSSAVLNAAGSGYTVGDGLTVTTLGAGYGFNVAVLTITTVNPAGEAKWAQAPRRLINATVSPFVPPNTNQQAIQYSAIIYPVSDSPLAPPIDTL
jgi:hypothetical protein